MAKIKRVLLRDLKAVMRGVVVEEEVNFKGCEDVGPSSTGCEMCAPYPELGPGYIVNANQIIPCFQCNPTVQCPECGGSGVAFDVKFQCGLCMGYGLVEEQLMVEEPLPF